MKQSILIVGTVAYSTFAGVREICASQSIEHFHLMILCLVYCWHTVQQVWESHETCEDSPYVSESRYSSNIKRKKQVIMLILNKWNPNLDPFSCVLKIIMQDNTHNWQLATHFLQIIIIIMQKKSYCINVLVGKY